MPRKKVDEDEIPSDFRDIDVNITQMPSDVELKPGTNTDTTTRSTINTVLKYIGGTARELVEEVINIGWEVRQKLINDAKLAGYVDVYQYLQDISKFYLDYKDAGDIIKLRKMYITKLQLADLLLEELETTLEKLRELYKLLLLYAGRQNSDLDKVYDLWSKEMNQMLQSISQDINKVLSYDGSKSGSGDNQESKGTDKAKAKDTSTPNTR